MFYGFIPISQGQWGETGTKLKLSASLALLPSGRVGSGLRYNRISELRAHILDSSEWEITRWLVLRKSGAQFSFSVLCNRLPKTFSRSTTLT